MNEVKEILEKSTLDLLMPFYEKDKEFKLEMYTLKIYQIFSMVFN